MDPGLGAVRSSPGIEALLHEPLLSWPEVSPLAVREVARIDSRVGGSDPDGRRGWGESGSERSHGAGHRRVVGGRHRHVPRLAAGSGTPLRDPVAPVWAAVARDVRASRPPAATCSARFFSRPGRRRCAGEPFAVAEFARETAVRQARKLILRAYGYERLVVMVELTGTWSTAQIEVAEANALWLAGPGELGVWLFGRPTAGMTRVPRSSLRGRMPTSAPPAAPRPPYLTPLRGRPNPFSRAEQRLEAHLARSSWATGRAWNQPWSSGVLANPIRVDLVWTREKCVVELDGPDHLNTDKYAADRARAIAGFSARGSWFFDTRTTRCSAT